MKTSPIPIAEYFSVYKQRKQTDQAMDGITIYNSKDGIGSGTIFTDDEDIAMVSTWPETMYSFPQFEDAAKEVVLHLVQNIMQQLHAF